MTHVGLRTSRLLDLAAALRASAGPRYPLGAIVPAPEGMRLNPAYWPGFPFRGLRADFNVFLPMDYFTYHVTTAAAAHDYTTANVALLRRDTRDPAVPIHLIGGIADTASVAEVTAFVHAARERGVLGASLYDDCHHQAGRVGRARGRAGEPPSGAADAAAASVRAGLRERPRWRSLASEGGVLRRAARRRRRGRCATRASTWGRTRCSCG